jgi:hypothetical protein
MKCNNCGAKNPKKYKFCKECGEALSPVAVTTPTQQPAVVVIQNRGQRRGVPGIIWALVGMILAVLLCGLSVWLDFVDVPETIRSRLPGPIGEFVDAIEDSREPGDPIFRFLVDPSRVQLREMGENLQSGIDYAVGTPDPCSEDVEDKFVRATLREEYYTGKSYIDFEFSPPLIWKGYDLIIMSDGVQQDRGFCSARDYFGDSSWGYHLCQADGPFEWPAGEVWFVFHHEYFECLVGSIEMHFDCRSGEAWYPNWPYGSPTGCCTVGCWCEHPSTGQPGCWEECAPQCAD